LNSLSNVINDNAIDNLRIESKQASRCVKKKKSSFIDTTFFVIRHLKHASICIYSCYTHVNMRDIPDRGYALVPGSLKRVRRDIAQLYLVLYVQYTDRYYSGLRIIIVTTYLQK